MKVEQNYYNIYYGLTGFVETKNGTDIPAYPAVLMTVTVSFFSIILYKGPCIVGA